MKEKVLVVEDDPIIRSNICDMVELDGIGTFQAFNGVEAMMIINTKKIALIITDWIMPEMDGLELLQKVKQSPSLAHIPVIMLTAKVQIEDKLDALHLGADDYLVKPFSSRELFLRVRNLLESRRKLTGKIITTGEMTDLQRMEDRFVADLREFIQANLSNDKLALADFTDHFNMGVSNFQKHVKKLTGKSVIEILFEYRLERAYELISTRTCTVSEAVFRCGFKNGYYFTKKFKQYYGVLPSKLYQAAEVVTINK